MNLFFAAIAVGGYAAAVYVAYALRDRARQRKRVAERVREGGMAWENVRNHLTAGRGSAIVDFSFGRARGLGQRVLYWSDEDLSGADSEAVYSALERGGTLTDCPRELLDVEALRHAFPEATIVENRVVRIEVHEQIRKSDIRALDDAATTPSPMQRIASNEK